MRGAAAQGASTVLADQRRGLTRHPHPQSIDSSSPLWWCLHLSWFVFLILLCGCIPPDANNNQKKSQTDKPPATTIVVKKFVLKLRKIAMKLRKPYRGSHRNLENPREDRIETQKIPLRILLKLRKSSRESGVSHFYLFLGFYEDLFFKVLILLYFLFVFGVFYTLYKYQFSCSMSTVQQYN